MSQVKVVKLSEGSRPVLFAAHASGGVLTYGRLARHLDSDQPLYLLKGEGIDTTDHAFRDIYHLARYYAEEIIRIQPDGPFMICGRTSEIVLEVGQQLMKLGKSVALTMVFDNGPPKRWRKGQAPGELRRMLFRGRRKLSIAVSRLLDQVDAVSARLPARLRFFSGLSHLSGIRIQRFSRKRGPRRPKRINWDLFADYAVQHYRARFIYVQSIGQKQKKGEYVDNWKALVDQLVYHMVPGEHSTMYDAPHVHVLAHIVQKECNIAADNPSRNDGPG